MSKRACFGLLCARLMVRTGLWRRRQMTGAAQTSAAQFLVGPPTLTGMLLSCGMIVNRCAARSGRFQCGATRVAMFGLGGAAAAGRRRSERCIATAARIGLFVGGDDGDDERRRRRCVGHAAVGRRTDRSGLDTTPTRR